jgi:hypothetical protein
MGVRIARYTVASTWPKLIVPIETPSKRSLTKQDITVITAKVGISVAPY